MERKTVKSSNIKSVGWEADSETLEIEFVSGSIYQYAGVTRGAYEAFIAAPSLGLWFHEKIRGVYDYKHMNPKPKGEDNGQSKKKAKSTRKETDEETHSETLGDA